MPFTPDELRELELENIHPDSLGINSIYKPLRGQGVSHRDALRKTIDDINAIESDSIPEEMLRELKRAMLTVPGQY